MHRIAGAACVLVFAAALDAQPAAQAFLDALNRALQSGDRSAVAAHIRYPAVVSIGGIRVPFPNAGALVERYDDIFTPALRDIVAREAVVTDGAGGFMVGAGALVLGQSGGELKILAIVVPPAAPSAESASSPTPAGGSSAPRRIVLRAGPRPTRFPGALLPGGADSYVVFVPQGQRLEVRLERVRAEAVVRVANAATGAPLNPRTAQGALVVSGRAPASADYRIDVQRRSDGDSHLPYMLAVEIR